MPDETPEQWLPAGRIPVVSPDGKLGHIPEANWGKAQELGYRFQTPAEQTAFYQKLKYGNRPGSAALAGAARGLTADLSDPVLIATGLAKRETLKGLEEANKGASTAAEIGSAGLSMLVPGLDEATAPGLIAKVGKLVEGATLAEDAGVLGRLGAKAAGGAAQGMLWGAGNAVHEGALGDSQETAEKVIGHITLGGLLGAGGELATGALAEGAGAAARAAGGGLRDIADKQALKAAGFMRKDFRAAGYKGIGADIAEALHSEGILKGAPTVADVADRAEARVSELGQRLGDIIDTADAKARPLVSGPDLAKEIRRSVVTPLANGNAGEQAIAGRLEKEAEAIEARGDMSFRQAEDYKRSFDKFLKFGAEQGPVQEGLKDIRRIIKRDVEDKLEAVGNAVAPGLGDEFRAAKKSYGLLSEAAEVARDRAEAMKSNLSVSLTDRLAAMGFAALTHGPLGLLTGAAGAVGNKLARERGPAVAANLLDALDKSIVATSFAGAAKEAALGGRLGDFAPIMLNALARGPGHGFLTHVGLVNTDNRYRETAALAGFPVEDAQQTAMIAKRSDALTVLRDNLYEHDAEVDRLLTRAMRGDGKHRPAPLDRQDFGTKRQRKEPTDAHETHADEILALAANPGALVDRVSKNIAPISEHAPAVAAAMTATAQRAVQHLAAKLQRPPPAGPIAPKWRPGRTDIDTFNRHLEVALHPKAALKHLATGTLTPEHVQTLQMVYPKLLARMQTLALERMAEHPKSIPYRVRLALATLTGVDVDGTMGAAIALNQIAIAATSRKPSLQGAPEGPAAHGAEKLTLAKRTATPSQSRDMRDEV